MAEFTVHPQYLRKLTLKSLHQMENMSKQCNNVNDTPNYSVKKILTLPDFSSQDGTMCYTVSATWECYTD